MTAPNKHFFKVMKFNIRLNLKDRKFIIGKIYVCSSFIIIIRIIT